MRKLYKNLPDKRNELSSSLLWHMRAPLWRHALLLSYWWSVVYILRCG